MIIIDIILFAILLLVYLCSNNTKNDFRFIDYQDAIQLLFVLCLLSTIIAIIVDLVIKVF